VSLSELVKTQLLSKVRCFWMVGLQHFPGIILKLSHCNDKVTSSLVKLMTG